MLNFLSRNETRISRIAMVIVFLALVRLIGECFRLQAIAQIDLTFPMLKPYLLGALLAAVACFIMTILYFYSRSKTIVFIAVLAISGLVAIKMYFHTP